MKVSVLVLALFLLAHNAQSFQLSGVPRRGQRAGRASSQRRRLQMAVDAPPAADGAPVMQQLSTTTKAAVGSEPTNWRYSEFINEVEANRVEKVTFASDGQSLLAVDTDGARHQLLAVPNDPELLGILTGHKVDVTVLPEAANKGALDLLQSLFFPAVLFAGLFFLTRRGAGSGGGGMPGGGGMGGGGPMDFGKSQAKLMMDPDTGIGFEDVAGCDGAKLELEEVREEPPARCCCSARRDSY